MCARDREIKIEISGCFAIFHLKKKQVSGFDHQLVQISAAIGQLEFPPKFD